MKKIILFYVVLVFFNWGFTQTPAWQKILDSGQKNLVIIEFYEEISSQESIKNGSKIKRTLNGIVVDSSGLVMTSSSLFGTQMDFSGSAGFGPENPPTDIKIKLGDDQFIDAEFVGKDDDKEVAFIKTQKQLPSKGIDFVTEAIPQIGSKIFIAFRLDENYKSQLAVLEKSVNSVIPGPPVRLLTDIGSGHNISFGLVFNEYGDALGVLRSVSSGQNFAFDFHGGTENPLAEVSLPEDFLSLIKDPPQFMKKNTRRKKWLGVNLQPFTRSMAEFYNEKNLQGILLNTIIEDSPAEKAGLMNGDVITEFNGIPLSVEVNEDVTYFRNLVRESEEEIARLKVWRKGKIRSVNVKLIDSPISQFLADEISSERLGFSAKELTRDIIMRKQLEYDIEGVWISKVEQAGWADIAGLQIGDLLIKVNDKALQNLDQLKNYLKQIDNEKPEYISFFIKRGAETQFLFIKTNFN